MLLVVLNVLWLGFSLTGLFLPPAAAAMFEVTHSLARQRTPGVTDYFRAVRDHFGRAWAWASLNFLIAVALLVNIQFYDQWSQAWAAWLQIAFLLIGIFWGLCQFYVWPYLLEQTTPSLRQALRNAAFTVMAWPSFSVVLVLLIALVLLISIVLLLPLVLITAAFLCLLANHAVLDRLHAVGKLPAPPSREDV